jgi:ribosome-associated protein
MDIRKLQRAIVDGLEDVKGQDIQVFNTEHLSPLFERVIIASGQSNRQTKALASSVRDAVKAKGLSILRVEGEENGEWIIVDCGAAVAHIMQPSIRDYYRLEEIWGGKPVKIKLGESRGGLVKASEGPDDDEDEPPKKAARPAPAKKAAPAKAAARKAPAKKAASARAAAAKKPASKAAPAKAPAAKKTRAGAAPAKTASVKKIVVPANSSRNAAKKAAPAKKAARPAARPAAKKTATRRG